MCAPVPDTEVAMAETETLSAPSQMDTTTPLHHQAKADALVSHPIAPSPSMDITAELGGLSSLNVRAAGFTPQASRLPAKGSSASSIAAPAVQGLGSTARALDPVVDSDTEPSTPEAVREALAAVHSLALTGGIVAMDRSVSCSGDGSRFSGSAGSPTSPVTVLPGSPPASSLADTSTGSKLSAVAKAWVPPSSSAAPTPLSATAAVSGVEEQGQWPANSWTTDGMYVASDGYDYSSWQEYDPAHASGVQYAVGAGQWGEVRVQAGEGYDEEGYNADDFYETSAYNYQVAAAYYPAKETEDAATAVLAMAFPSYSAAALRKVLRKANVDIAAAAEELTQMETEHAAQQKVAAAARKPKATGPPAPVLDESNFPSLGAGAPGVAAVPSWAGSSQVKDSVKAPPTPEESAAAIATAKEMLPKSEAAAGRTSAGKASGAVTWVETGDAVSSQYAAARQEAGVHARVRNAYFQQATQAYLAGNKALAKDLGAKGRSANEAMKKSHASASQKIFTQRNNSDRHQGSPLQTPNGEPMIDLHGQHVAEGLAALRRELSRLRSTPAADGEDKRPLYVCVGAGNHTKGAQTPARLPAAVEAFLREKGISYSEPQRGLILALV